MLFFVVFCDVNSEARWHPRTLVRSLLIISNFICFCKQASFLECLNQRKSKTLAKRLGRNTVYLMTRHAWWTWRTITITDIYNLLLFLQIKRKVFVLNVLQERYSWGTVEKQLWNLISMIVTYVDWGQQLTVRSSRPEVFCKKGVLKNFVKFQRKHLSGSLFLISLKACNFNQKRL